MNLFTASTNTKRTCRSGLLAGLAQPLLVSSMALALACAGIGCVSGRAPSAERFPELRKQWGIEITSLRLSGHGHLIDFRYRVVDPGKAALLADRRFHPVLIDQVTGMNMRVPDTPKLGPLRQSATRLETGKIYFMLFANAGCAVKSGGKVTVVIGDFRAENLKVE